MSRTTLSYELLGGNRHRHGGGLVHEHPHTGAHTHSPEPHSHDHEHHHGGHGHSHGLVDESIKRSREGLRAVGLSLAVLALAAVAQLAIFVASGSIALLADLIHNFGDAAPRFRSASPSCCDPSGPSAGPGLFVVATIFVSACVAGVEAISRLIHPQAPTHLLALAAAGLIGFARQLDRGDHPHPRRRAPRQPGADRRRQPRPRRLLRQPRRGRQRGRRRARPTDRRSADRPRASPR